MCAESLRSPDKLINRDTGGSTKMGDVVDNTKKGFFAGVQAPQEPRHLVAQRQAAQRKTIDMFISDQMGVFVVFSHDNNFYKNLKSISDNPKKDEYIKKAVSAQELQKLIKDLNEQNRPIVIFIENIYKNKSDISLFDTTDLMSEILQKNPAIKMLCLMEEKIPKEKILFLSERGAKWIITKPISCDNIVSILHNIISGENSALSKQIDEIRSFMSQKRFKTALQLLTTLVEKYPDLAVVRIVWGEFYEKMGDSVKEHNLESGHISNPKVTQDIQNFYDLARRDYELAVSLVPDNNRYRQILADFYDKLYNFTGDLSYKEAKVAVYGMMIATSPLNSEHCYAQGEACVEMVEAIQTQRKKGLGGNIQSGKEGIYLDEADSAYRQALKMDGKNTSEVLSSKFSKVAETMERISLERAIAYAKGAIKSKGKFLVEEDLEKFNKLGILYRKLATQNKDDGKPEEAKKHLEEAISWYNKAFKVSPENPNLYYNIAVIYYEIGKYKKSLDEINKALDKDPYFYKVLGDKTHIALFSIANIFLKNNHRAETIKYLELALESNPNYEPAQKLLKNILGA